MAKLLDFFHCLSSRSNLVTHFSKRCHLHTSGVTVTLTIILTHSMDTADEDFSFSVKLLVWLRPEPHNTAIIFYSIFLTYLYEQTAGIN